MKLAFRSFLVFSLLFNLSCQNQKDFLVAETYEEPQDPTPVKNEAWSDVSEGLQASVTSTNIRFVKSEIPKTDLQTTWSGAAWKGERVAAQLVLWSTDSLTEVNTEISDFKSHSGNSLASSIADINFVKYVITDEFAGGCGNRKPEDFDSSLAADILEPEKIRIQREDFSERNMEDDLDHLNQTVAQFNVTTKPKNLESILEAAKNELNVLAEKKIEVPKKI